MTDNPISALLGLYPENVDHVRSLITQFATRAGVLPFVGAGLSRSAGFPLWKSFLEELARQARIEDQIKQRIDATPPQYEEAASDLLQALQPRRFQDLLAGRFGDQVITGKRLADAVAELPKFPPGPIVTTNFDRVLETTFEQAGKKLTPFWHSQASKGSEALQQDKPFLLKLHGDWEDPKSRILTLEEYESAYGDITKNQISFNLPIPTLLFTLLSSRCCLFLGCSLSQDRTIRLLNAISRGIPDLVHYAIVEQPETSDEMRRRVADFGGSVRPIWYPHGKHETVQVLLSYLAAKASEGFDRATSRLSIASSPVEITPHNIPNIGNVTIGRQSEVLQVSSMLTAARCVSITGPGGCGKSRLAIEIARALMPRFPSGIWFIPLADLAKQADKERVLPTRIGKIAGVPEQAGRPPHEALADHFSSGRYLLVLDNCEHLITSSTEIVKYLLDECPHLTILTTSRRALKLPQERIYPLGPLETPSFEVTSFDDICKCEAVTLFAERAKERSREFVLDASNVQAVAGLSRALDGIPLALEVAAARLSVRSVEQMNAESRDLLHTVGNIKSGDLRRWKTLTAALKWSYGLLDHHQRAFMRSLAIFDGGWTEKAAEAVYRRPPSDSVSILDHLQALYENSLILCTEVRGVKRFRFLEPIRQLAQSQLQPEERMECESRHAGFFLQLAEKAAPEFLKSHQVDWLEVLQTEADNLRAVFRWAVATANAEIGLRLFIALWRFLEIRGYFTEGRKRAEAVLRIPGSEHLLEYRSKALSGAGMLAYRQTDLAIAEQMFTESLAIEESLQNNVGIANALNDLGNVASQKGDYDRARELYTRSLHLQRLSANTRGIAVASFNLGATALYTGDYEQAEHSFLESLWGFEEEGNDRESGFSLNGLAQVAITGQNLELAEEYAARSLAARRKVKDTSGIADTLRTLGWASIEAKAFEKARERLLESLRLSWGVGDRRGISQVLELSAMLLADGGQWSRAVELFAASSKIQTNHFHKARALALRRESTLDSARKFLGERGYADSWRRGEFLTVGDTIEGILAKERFGNREQEPLAKMDSPSE